MSIQMFLDVTFAHIPSPDAISEVEEYVLAKGDEDVFLFVPELDEDYMEIPNWFREICTYALNRSCYYIRLSSIGASYRDLELYRWD
jgi:hypothetical protein